eukprot:3889277-Amphidinium_carterae.1
MCYVLNGIGTQYFLLCLRRSMLSRIVASFADMALPILHSLTSSEGVASWVLASQFCLADQQGTKTRAK